MQLHYVFGALILLGLLQYTLAHRKIGTRKRIKPNPNDCHISWKTNTTALQSGLEIDCFNMYITELNVTGTNGKICASLLDKRFEKCAWQSICYVTAKLTTECSEQLNISFVCRRGSMGSDGIVLSTRRYVTPYASGRVQSHYHYGTMWPIKTKIPEIDTVLKARKDQFVFTIYRMNIGTEKLTVVAKDAKGATKNFSFTGALTLSDDLSKRTHVIDDIKSQNVTVSLSGLQHNDTSSGFGLCYKWMQWNSTWKKEKFDTCKLIAPTCFLNTSFYYYKRMKTKIGNMKSPDCHLPLNTSTKSLATGQNISCISYGTHIAELNITGKDGETIATIKDQPLQQCAWKPGCSLKVNLTTMRSKPSNLSFVCRRNLQDLHKMYYRKRHVEPIQWIAPRMRYSNPMLEDLEGVVVSDIYYGWPPTPSKNRSASSLTLLKSYKRKRDHFAFTVYSMNIGAETLSVVAEDISGRKRKFSFTGALTPSNDISNRTRVINDIKPHSITVSLKGLHSNDTSQGFRLCYRWMNWDSNLDKETFDTCQHFTNTMCLPIWRYKWIVRKMRMPTQA